MKIICGPKEDRREVEVSLPSEVRHSDRPFRDRIGVFVSGGIDSAILYYLLCLQNKSLDTKHKIVPLVVSRKEGSRYFPKMIIDYIHDRLEMPRISHGVVGDSTLEPDQQVRSGVIEAFEYEIKPVYLGLIQNLPEHMIGWEPIIVEETDILRVPFKNLNKSHIIDLVYQHGQEFLFNITHSCVTREIGRCGSCNGCRERQWGFERLGQEDPGNI